MKSSNYRFGDTMSLEDLKLRVSTYEIPAQFLDSTNFFGGTLQSGSLTFIYDDSCKLYKDSLLNTYYDFDIKKKNHVYIAYYLNKKLVLGAQAYDIYYTKVIHEGREYWGYLPEHKLALNWLQLAPQTYLYTTIRDHDKDLSPIAKTSLYKDGSLVNEISYVPAYQPEGGDTVDYYYCLESAITEGSSLTQIQKTIKVISHYPACGYSSGESLILYDGEHIFYGLNTSNYFDAGSVANYSNIETPQDTSMAKKHIFVTVNNISYQEENGEVASHDSTILNYEWTLDNKLVFVDTLAKVKIK